MVATAGVAHCTQSHRAAGTNGLVGRCHVGIAKAQRFTAGIQRHTVGAYRTAGRTAHRRTSSGQGAVIGLGCSSNCRCSTELHRIDVHRSIGVVERWQLVIGCRAASAIG